RWWPGSTSADGTRMSYCGSGTSPFCCTSSVVQRVLRSFPTRRSSDLASCCATKVPTRSAPSRTLTSHASSLPTKSKSDSCDVSRSEEHTSELQSPCNLVCRLLLEKKNNGRSALRIA